MSVGKATRSDVRRHNRELVLRAVYTQAATNRAALAQETGLTKPAVSDLVGELIDEGLLIEEGFGESTDSGGKRPRLLRFLPHARQVIGVALHQQYALGVLTNLDGRVVVEHQADLASTNENEVFEALIEVIHGLLAQSSAPLQSLSVGISGIVDDRAGVVQHAPRFGWYNVPLSHWLLEYFRVPVYVSNSTELATRAQIAFGALSGTSNLVTLLLGNSIGIGHAHTPTTYHTGNDIGTLVLEHGDTALQQRALEQIVGWQAVKSRAQQLGQLHASPHLQTDALTYLHIRYAIACGDPAALALQAELSASLARVIAWAVALMRPDHVSLVGPMADLGDEFLNHVIQSTRSLIVPDLIERTGFSIDTNSNLVAVGAVAKALQLELGLIY